MRAHLAAILVSLAAVAMLAMSPVDAASEDEIRSTFSKFIAAQNAHDLKAVGELLSDSSDFLWIESGRIVRGRDAAIDRFGELFQSAWRVDPDWSTFQIVMLDVSTAEIFVRVSTTIGGPAQSAQVNHILVKTARGWRVLSILPGGAPPDSSPREDQERESPRRHRQGNTPPVAATDLGRVETAILRDPRQIRIGGKKPTLLSSAFGHKRSVRLRHRKRPFECALGTV